MDDRDRALYIISVAAELAGVHAQTLRIYERKGLIAPSRTEGGSRRYSDRDITLLHRIQELTNEGVSLAGVRKVLDLEADVADALDEIRRLRATIDELRAEVRDQVEAVHRQYRRSLVPVSTAVVDVRR